MAMPQQQNGEQPPPYDEVMPAAGGDQGQGIINQQNQAAPAGYYQQNQTILSYNQNQPVIVTGQPNVAVVQVTVTQITMTTYLRDNLRHPLRRFEGKQNAANSFKGFLDVLQDKEKLPWNFAKKLIYKVGLLVYYLVNFIYSVVAIGVQANHIGYHLAYLFVSLIGLSFELTDISIDIRKWVIQFKKNRVENTGNRPRQGWTEGADNMSLASVESNEQNNPQDNDSSMSSQPQMTYKKKAKVVFIDYVLRSFGEILIYPTFICVFYGFINEKAWKFNNGLSAFYFLLFLYSFVMDAVYVKFYMIWLVIRTVRASFTKYDELREKKLEWTRFFTPVYLTIPFAILLAIAHWFMIGIIGVRIYVDNFTPDHDTGGVEPTTGNYTVAPYTLFIIFCAVYLLIASWLVYIRLNKFWFYEIYSLINQFSATPADYIWTLPWNMKLTAFIVDPVSYFVVIFLMVPFIVFVVATYLPDYDDSDFEVASSARNAVQGLGPCFIAFFLLANLQASIIFTILVLIIISILLYILFTVCAVLGCINDVMNCR